MVYRLSNITLPAGKLSGSDPMKNWHCRKKSVSIPQIRLQGKWLQECGFDPGSQVQIQCEQGKLIITLE